MPEYPLVFTLRDPVFGKGFFAGVTVSGRALMTQEDGAWWVYGVRPSALADHGATPPEAYTNFRKRYTEVLFDIASESDSYEAFVAEVELFFNENDLSQDERWEAAVKDVRAGAVEPDGPFATLPKEPAGKRPLSVRVERLDVGAQLSPDMNLVDQFATAA